ncbi:MAG: 4Fe-4S binding protein [Firmicutes bacterium]|nr:4Fe-4S binding protein [Bacillota bacterium]
MYLVEVNRELCSGCGECVGACPAKLLALDGEKKSFVQGDPAECLGCESCTILCTRGAVKVTEY